MTETFCEKVVLGGTVARPAKHAHSVSLNSPPCKREPNWVPSMASLLTSVVAVILAHASLITTRYDARNGSTNSPRTESGNR